ncbi:hypothetical protein V6N13_020600 [Hibiscus sabdariffa]
MDEVELTNLAVGFYRDLFTVAPADRIEYMVKGQFSSLTTIAHNGLICPVSNEEIKNVISILKLRKPLEYMV